jgi:hypothetical protein
VLAQNHDEEATKRRVENLIAIVEVDDELDVA